MCTCHYANRAPRSRNAGGAGSLRLTWSMNMHLSSSGLQFGVPASRPAAEPILACSLQTLALALHKKHPGCSIGLVRPQRGFQLHNPLILLPEADFLMPRRGKRVALRPNTDPHKQKAQLDAGAQCAPHPKHAIATPEPADNCHLVGNLLLTVDNPDPQECGVRLGSQAVECFSEDRIHSVAHDNSCGDDVCLICLLKG